MAIVDKRRTDMNVAEVMNVIGDVQDKTCLIIDDIIDTAGTLVNANSTRCLRKARARFAACASHPVLSGPAVERIANSASKRADRHQHHPSQRREPQKAAENQVLSIAGLLGRGIESVHMETSISTLFN